MIIDHFYYKNPSNGYATLVCLIVFLSSIQMIMIGILGEYIGKIHIETKNRPMYFSEFLD